MDGLTQTEIGAPKQSEQGGKHEQYRDGDYMRFARAIEAAHGIKEKNNG
jgi:hypothetical protein